MKPLNIRDIGEERKRALDAEALARGIPVAELVRRFIDEGLSRTEAERARLRWLEEAKPGLAFEAEALARDGPTLAHYRRIATADRGA